MNRREAILTGMREAAALHDRFGIRQALETGSGPVDVFNAIAELSIPTMFRPLTGMLGLYVPPPTGPGIMVTTQRSLHMQRFTAAHELGHHILGHTFPSFDKRIGFVSSGLFKRAPMQEIAADAFASEFMIPRWLLVAHARRRGWSRESLTNPGLVYQLSLRLGMSYQATCFALASHEMVTRPEVEGLLEVAPKESKRKLLGTVVPESWWNDVWDISPDDDGSLLEGGPGDIFVLALQEHAASGYTWDIESAKSQGYTVLSDNRTCSQDDELGSVLDRRVLITGHGDGMINLEEKRSWSNDDPLNSVTINLSSLGKEYLPMVTDQLAA